MNLPVPRFKMNLPGHVSANHLSKLPPLLRPSGATSPSASPVELAAEDSRLELARCFANNTGKFSIASTLASTMTRLCPKRDQIPAVNTAGRVLHGVDMSLPGKYEAAVSRVSDLAQSAYISAWNASNCAARAQEATAAVSHVAVCRDLVAKCKETCSSESKRLTKLIKGLAAERELARLRQTVHITSWGPPPRCWQDWLVSSGAGDPTSSSLPHSAPMAFIPKMGRLHC